MDNIKTIATGTIVTLLIGGTAYTFNQADVVNNLAEDTGMTQEQAEQYVNNIPEEELVSFYEVGSDYISEGEATLALAKDIDCVNYEYEWESITLTCSEGKVQLQRIGDTERLLGQAYMKLESDSASENDILAAIRYLDQLNSDYELEIAVAAFDTQALDEMKMTNSYNKSLLKAALESN